MHWKAFFQINITGIIYMLVILFLCLSPTEPFLGDVSLFEMDKLAHIFIFFTLTLINTRGFRRYSASYNFPANSLLISGLVSVAFGFLIEILQQALPTGRQFEWYDLLANSTGVALSLLFLRWRRS